MEPSRGGNRFFSIFFNTFIDNIQISRLNIEQVRAARRLFRKEAARERRNAGLTNRPTTKQL